MHTEPPIAITSPDHIIPHGTAQDNSHNSAFTTKIIYLFHGLDIKILDLGCSGGGQVRNFIERGYFSIGVEGSDYSLKRHRAEQSSIPEFLFTADITKPFYINYRNHSNSIKFDVITMWEVIEHIAEADLSLLAKNIDNHLDHGGLLIMSVSPNEEIIDGIKLHQTVYEKSWWVETFNQLGFIHNENLVSYFQNDLVRFDGPGGNAPNSFHLFLTRKEDIAKFEIP